MRGKKKSGGNELVVEQGKMPLMALRTSTRLFWAKLTARLPSTVIALGPVEETVLSSNAMTHLLLAQNSTINELQWLQDAPDG